MTTYKTLSGRMREAARLRALKSDVTIAEELGVSRSAIQCALGPRSGDHSNGDDRELFDRLFNEGLQRRPSLYLTPRVGVVKGSE